MLECSPLEVLRSNRTLSIGKRKIKDVTKKFKNVVSIALSEPQLTENSDCSNCQRLVDSIKEKLTDCSNERKIKNTNAYSCSRRLDNTKNSAKFFNVSEHAVKQVRKLKKEKGILATTCNYYREGLDKETKKMCC